MNCQDKYIIIQKVSQGSYGVVYKARNKQTGQFVAIKKFKDLTQEGIPTSCIRELNIVNLLKFDIHEQNNQKRTLILYDTYYHNDSIMMVVEWLDINLYTLINSNQHYDCKRIFSGVVKSLKEIHQNYIIHRDLKTLNIMIKKNKDGLVKIIDYGMSKQYTFEEKPMTNEVGSLYYRAPQLLMGFQLYLFQIDIWSLGCIFYQLLTKKIMFKGKTELQQLHKILAVTGTPKQENYIYKEFKAKLNMPPVQQNWSDIKAQIGQVQYDLLRLMLQINPKQRLSCQQILKHQFFQQNPSPQTFLPIKKAHVLATENE